MKSKFLKNIKLLFIVIIFINSNFSHAAEEFTFDITEIEITQNSNLIVGSKGGKAVTKDGYEITAENFVYNKVSNILNAEGKVKLINKKNDFVIYSDKATYLKNDEIVFTEGDTSALIEKDYYFTSKNLKYLKNEQQISSKSASTVEDKDGNIYKTDNFIYFIRDRLLKGSNLNIVSKIDDEKKDNYYFSDGFFNLKSKSFVAKNTNIKVHKDIFENEEQDPRIYGVSSFGNENKTVINKGVFTSCKLTEKCPPWRIESKKITHDKIKKNLIYDNALLKIYDVPVFYLPKFMHPDPTVKRRSGFLQPQLNRSKTLGDSIYIPYFKTLGIDKDYTFKPTFFDDKKKIILQNELRKKNKYSSLIADFSLMTGYKSSSTQKRKRINHLFLNFDKNLNYSDFLNSNMRLKVQRVNNDTYLKVFQHNLFPSPVLPNNKDIMQTSLNYDFDHEKYNLSTEFTVYEDLSKKTSDRYQYVFPSYNFDKNLDFEKINGSINFSSSGQNNLKNTNNLTTSITNDISYNSINYLSKNGFKNNFNVYFKNLNSVGKNDNNYTSSPSVDGMSIFEFQSSLPLIKINNLSEHLLTPKISFRANPGNNMKNHSDANRVITAGNAFAINRLGLSDSYESGKSLTFGLDYRIDFKDQDEINEEDKYLEFKLATVVRDKIEKNIPLKSTIDKKNSNLFGTIQSNFLKNTKISYDFSIDNDYKTFESHSLNTEFSINNFVTSFNYIEQREELGTSHVISNTTSYNIDENNSFSFSTRRNKNISLTEYYNLAYEYKNDCLTAAIKYNRTFYEDDDLVPSENLFLTVTLIPLTTYERRLYERDKYGNYNFGE